ncbi:hypothetical protein BDZ45DRAFT_738392 [Acephala macrosclerotiorum]|nr:hypothetical protein BDZ45DRAFT_738392 [Acephala macrosclerotiorum]
MGFAIRDGFRSGVYPFLETLTPTDLDPNRLQSKRLSDAEKAVLTFKKTWLSTPYPEQLAVIVAQIIEDRKENPISNVVCIGIGGGGSRNSGVNFDTQQFVVVSQIVAQLAVANPELLGNITFQDVAMQPYMKALFLNHGCQVVEHPAAFKLVNATTFFISAFVRLDTVMKELEGRPTGELAMFMGNGDQFAAEAKTSSPYFSPDLVAIPAMFDLELTNHEDLPCDRPNGKSYNAPGGTMRGLSPFDLWWRPVRTDEQKFKVRLDAALSLGFPGDVEEFRRAYQAGYAEINHTEQHRFIYNFMAARFNGNVQSIEGYLFAWIGGKSDEQKKHEKDVNRFLSILYDPECKDRTFTEYLNGFTSL